MSEKRTAVSYDYKKEVAELKEKNAEINKKVRNRNITIGFFSLVLMWSVDTNFDNKPSQYILDKLIGEKKIETVTNPTYHDKIKINAGETLEHEATEAFKNLATENEIDPSTLDYEAIQQQSVEAQKQNNLEGKTYEGNEYDIGLTQQASGTPETTIAPSLEQ